MHAKSFEGFEQHLAVNNYTDNAKSHMNLQMLKNQAGFQPHQILQNSIGSADNNGHKSMEDPHVHMAKMSNNQSQQESGDTKD